jgi:hypothetical protein
MASEPKNLFYPEEVMAGILLTTVEPQTAYQLSDRLYRLKQKGIDVNIDNRRTPDGFFSEGISNYLGRMEAARFLNKKEKGGYVLNERGFRTLGSMLGKACIKDNEKYSKLLDAINS